MEYPNWQVAYAPTAQKGSIQAFVERRVLAEMRHPSPPDRSWHGTSGNMLLYVQHDTLRGVSLAYAVHVCRDQVQAVVLALTGRFDLMLHEYARAGHDPTNSCLEMRVTDVDRADALGIEGAVPRQCAPRMAEGMGSFRRRAMVR